MALSGTVYRLASSMSDHTPVLFNVFDDWNEESVVPHFFFYSICIRFERKRLIRRPVKTGLPYIRTSIHIKFCCGLRYDI